jgi:hypothetical protein
LLFSAATLVARNLLMLRCAKRAKVAKSNIYWYKIGTRGAIKLAQRVLLIETESCGSC